MCPQKSFDRRIRFTCLHPCCPLIQVTWWFIWEVTIVLFVYYHWISFLWQIEQLQRPKWISRVWIGWQKYVITLIETVYWFGSLLLYEKQNAVIVVKSKMLITFSRLPYRRRHWKIVIVSFPLWINAQEYELNSG